MDLWLLEHEIYGTWLSPGLFEQLDKVTPNGRQLAREMAQSWPALPPGTYLLPGVVARRKFTRTRTGTPMVWLTLVTESSYIDIAVFTARTEEEPDLFTAMRFLHEGTLILATTQKSRYKGKDGWRMTSRLQGIRGLG